MSIPTVTHALIDLDGVYAPSEIELTDDLIPNYKQGRYYPVLVETLESMQRVLNENRESTNVWGMSEEGELTLVEQLDDEATTIDECKARSIAFQEGFFVGMFIQKYAERAYGVTPAPEAVEEHEIHVVFYSQPFRVRDHQIAYDQLSNEGLRVVYDPQDPTLFTVAARHAPGSLEELRELFSEILAENSQVVLVEQRVNLTDPLQSSVMVTRLDAAAPTSDKQCLISQLIKVE